MLGRVFAIFSLAVGLSILSANTAEAGAGKYGQKLLFVTDTAAPTPQGGTFALCHLVSYAEFAFVPIYSSIDGYALSGDGCTGESYRELTREQLVNLQTLGVIPQDVPATPRMSIVNMIVGHAGPLLLALGALFKGLAWLIHDFKPRRRRTKGSDALAVNALAAMAHVAVSDGHIDNSEVTQIAGILTRLTGRGFDRGRVHQLLQQMQMNGNDLDELGQSLSEAERHIVMEAALHVAVADGEIHPNEYQIVSQIATRLCIDGTAFRSALARISAHLNPNGAAV